jgi:hypothetical protein
VAGYALQPHINWRYVSKQPLQPEYPSYVHLRQTHVPWAKKTGGNIVGNIVGEFFGSRETPLCVLDEHF